MRLTNMLKQPGGVSEQGHELELRLRYRGAQGVPCTRTVSMVLLPVSEAGVLAAQRAAQEAASKPDARLPEGGEFVLRLLQQSARDPGDLSKPLIEDARDLQALADGLVGPQYSWIASEYRKLIATEYPDLVTKSEADALEEEARAFSDGDQPAPG